MMSVLSVKLNCMFYVRCIPPIGTSSRQTLLSLRSVQMIRAFRRAPDPGSGQSPLALLQHLSTNSLTPPGADPLVVCSVARAKLARRLFELRVRKQCISNPSIVITRSYRSSSSTNHNPEHEMPADRQLRDEVETGVRKQNGDGAISSEKTPKHVQVMRHKMRTMHGINEVGFQRKQPWNQTTASHVESCSESDFYGIESEDLNNEEVKKDAGDIRKKFTFLGRKATANYEKVLETPYGIVRMDSHNTPSRQQSGAEQTDAINLEMSSMQIPTEDARKQTVESESGIRNRFQDINHVDSSQGRSNKVPRKKQINPTVEEKPINPMSNSPSYFDSQYFPERDEENASLSKAPQTESKQKISLDHEDECEDDFFGVAHNQGISNSSGATEAIHVTNREFPTKPVHTFDEQYCDYQPGRSHTGLPETFSQDVTRSSSNRFPMETKLRELSGQSEPHSGTPVGQRRPSKQGHQKIESVDGEKYRKGTSKHEKEDYQGNITLEQHTVDIDRRAIQEKSFTYQPGTVSVKDPGYTASVDNSEPDLEFQNWDNSVNLKKSKLPRRNLPYVNKESSRGSSETPSFGKDSVEDDDIHVGGATQQQKRMRTLPKPNLEDPQTAFDMAMKIRQEESRQRSTNRGESQEDKPHEKSTSIQQKWTGKVDSHGFRILTQQVLDIQNMPEDIVVNILKDSILYDSEELIAIDKPYGLPSHGGPGVHNSVGKFLAQLASKVDKSGSLANLYLIHRLDKETTGIMLLAKSEQTAIRVREMFKKRQVVKTYWVITRGVPQSEAGIIDIPIAEGKVGDQYRMTLRPDYKADTKLLMKTARHTRKTDAITKYRVLSSEGSAALIECEPESGLKHQIRCHLAFGLNTPILGDHKYSHFSKLAPQKLYPDMLQRLGIRQAKVRHVPMHLHAKAVVLPEFQNGRNLFISARLPKHFVQNMKWLKLKPPSKS